MPSRPRLTPAIADVRRAVRTALAPLGPGGDRLVLVALSGGAGSPPPAAATAFEAPRVGFRAGAIIVDHGLQSGSAAVAEGARVAATGLGLHPVEVLPVAVGTEGGPEAAARSARYTALGDAAQRHDAVRVLLA